MNEPDAGTEAWLAAAVGAELEEPIELTLYVSGASDLSARAIANAKRFCETTLSGPYELVVVDVHENIDALLESQVLAAPTLVKSRPPPERRIVGDLSRPEKVLRALGLPDPPVEPAAR